MEDLNSNQDGFQHLDTNNRELAYYDLGIKFLYDETPIGKRAEPQLCLFVSVRDLISGRDLGIFCYAQPCTYLRHKVRGRPPEKADEESLKAAVLHRLPADLKTRSQGIPVSSEEQPIFIRHTL